MTSELIHAAPGVFSLEALAVRVSARFPPHLRYYAKHLVLELGSFAGPELQGLTPETTVSEIVDWTEFRMDVARLSYLLSQSLPFPADLGDPLDANATTFGDVVSLSYVAALEAATLFGSPRFELPEPR